ncbi:MAG: hypothetical protein WA921_12135 [Ahrensia sp.]
MEIKDLPISGMTVIAAVGYAAISYLVTGPLVVDRTVQKSGWVAQCQRDLHGEIQSSRQVPEFTPQLDCNSILGMFGNEGQQLCRKYGNFKVPLFDQLNDYQRRIQEQEEARLAQAADASTYRCDCAVSLTQETRRIPFALHAGSARLITPAAIKNLNSELQTSLRSPLCAGKQ